MKLGRAAAVTALLGVAAGCADDPSDVPIATTTTMEVVVPSSEPEMEASPPSGLRTVSGSVEYSNAFFTMGVNDPLVILEDQSGFVTRNRNFVMPVESQTLASITSDFRTSPFTYLLNLPAAPQGGLHDVDNDPADETGVMVFAVAYWTNAFGDAYLEERDLGGGGWSTAYASTRVSTDEASYLEVTGGRLLVFAPDADQGFPTGFGADSKLFTPDDPAASIPAGWSLIDLDTAPFTVSQPDAAEVDLIEPESSALDDFSKLKYPEAFDAMVDKFRTDYAFTELKQVDWDALAATFRPQVEAASTAKEFAEVLDRFVKSVPDGHLGVITPLLDDQFTAVEGGIGLALAEADDGTAVVSFITPGGPADNAGIVVGATVQQFGGRPTAEAAAAVEPLAGPSSSERGRRLQQFRYLSRFPLGSDPIEVTFTNPDAPQRTVRVEVTQDWESFEASSIYAGFDGSELPVEFKLLPSGAGYIRLTSFSDDMQLTVRLWERALGLMASYGVDSLVLDLRANGGGSGYIADQMAAYLFDERTVVGNSGYYSEARGEFWFDPDVEAEMIPPPPAQRFSGKVVAIVGPGCFSACEFFGFDIGLQDRATIVGYDATDGLGGGVEQFAMPAGIMVQITIGRSVDADGNIHIEGIGVVPDVKVPRTVDTIIREANGEDVLLAAAEEALA